MIKVVADTTKVRIFEQITTTLPWWLFPNSLLLIPQRYEFLSKSQPEAVCQAVYCVVADTTKVRIFEQITTVQCFCTCCILLLLIPQRYEFLSKSQLWRARASLPFCCCWYHKGTNFWANHNLFDHSWLLLAVVADTTKVRIFEQITT